LFYTTNLFKNPSFFGRILIIKSSPVKSQKAGYCLATWQDDFRNFYMREETEKVYSSIKIFVVQEMGRTKDIDVLPISETSFKECNN